jgi:Tol biopolymer transport system component
MLSIFLMIQLIISDINISNTIVFSKYENKQVKIYSYNFDNNKIQYIINGYEPDIFEENNFIAYIKDSSSYPGNRELTLYDYKQKTERPLNFPNIYNCSSPFFSPDGKYLLFSCIIDTYKFLKFYEDKIDFKNFEYAEIPEIIDGWQLGILDIENSKFIKITEILYDKIKNYYAPVWTSDGRHILFHDLHNLYKIDIEGNIVNQFEIRSILGEDYQKYMNSNVYFHISPDGKYLLFNCSKLSMDEYIKGDFSPIECATIFDFESKNLKRITPKGFISINPVWIKNGKRILVQGFSIYEKLRRDRLLILNPDGEITKQMTSDQSGFYFSDMDKPAK